MNTKNFILRKLLISLLLISCSSSSENDLVRLSIAPNSVTCSGAHGDQKCLKVNGSLWYDGITGYKHKEGKPRTLWARKISNCLPSGDCMADVSEFSYEFVRYE